MSWTRGTTTERIRFRPIFPDGMDEEKKNNLRAKLIAEKLVEPDHPFLDQ